MKIGSKGLEAKKVKVIVDTDSVATSFEKWAQPGHFSRTLAKGPKLLHGFGICTLMLMILIVRQIHLKTFLEKYLVPTSVNYH